MESYLNAFLQNLADLKDSGKGGALFGSGRRRRKGRGIITNELGVENEMIEQGEGLVRRGSALYGGARRRRAATSFDIGKYSRAISQGYTKAEAKAMGRK